MKAKKKQLLLCLFIVVHSIAYAQPFTIVENLNKKNFEEEFSQVTKGLEILFNQIDEGEISTDNITSTNPKFTIDFIKYFKNLSAVKDKEDTIYYKPEIVNFYPIDNKQFMLEMVLQNKDASPIINAKLELIADLNEKIVRFDLPLDYRTRYWKRETVGTVNYIYQSKFNKQRAAAFNQKNIELAEKFELEPKQLTFFLVDNFQELLYLTGTSYLHEDNGRTRDGYGVVHGVIFSTDHNEDFSHDLVHNYMGQKYSREERNRTAEEGMAYYLGDAYYTDKNGEMIQLDYLVSELKKYLEANPEKDALTLYKSDEKIFNYIALEISVQRTISGILYREIELNKGFDAALDFVLSGRKERLAGVFRKTDEHLDIREDNFNEKLGSILKSY